MRTEPCVCGGIIVVPEEHSPAPYVEAHGFLPGHQAWRAKREGWHYSADDRYDDPRRERPTASHAGAPGRRALFAPRPCVRRVRPPLPSGGLS